MLRSTAPGGFTLIELLVVITIIVVLLSLLAPAMDGAIYQAELAVCGAKLHGLSMATLAYAGEHKRLYPDRVGAVWPNQLTNTPNKDDRPLFGRSMSINGQFLCPLSGEVNLEDYSLDAANRMVMTYSSYVLWFNFRYTNIPLGPTKPMRRLGDRLEVGGDTFRVLAMDTDAVREAAPAISFAAHPDARGDMSPWTLQSQPYDGAGFIASAGHNYAFWWWRGGERGPIDSNYAYDDGSVRRIDGVAFAIDDAQAADAGMARLPIHPTNAHKYRLLVPTR